MYLSICEIYLMEFFQILFPHIVPYYVIIYKLTFYIFSGKLSSIPDCSQLQQLVVRKRTNQIFTYFYVSCENLNKKLSLV